MFNYRQKTLLLATAAIVSMGVVSCVVTAEPAPAATTPAVTVGTDYYTPLYHDGYVVFFDARGLPYYYLDGSMIWIPASHAFYGRYVGYYARHRSHYWRWHRARGSRYRTYRRRSTTRARHHHHRRQPTQRGRSGGGRGGSGGGGGGRGSRR